MPNVTIVILNWNGIDDTLECLDSLRASPMRPRLLVVDNGSDDNSVERIRESGLADEVIATGENLGYAGGNNAGIRRALEDGADVIGVLNNDTIATRDMLEHLLPRLEDGEAVSPDIRYSDDPSVSWFGGATIGAGRPLHSSIASDGETPALSGCCIFATKATWNQVGLFDEAFVLFFEDYDWSFRARSRGVKLRVVASATLLHKVSRSFRRARSQTEIFYGTRNWLLFAWRWRRRDLPAVLKEILLSNARTLKRGEIGSAWACTIGVAAFLAGQRGFAPRRLLT